MDLARVNQIEGELLRLPQVECPVTHGFSPGVYLRTISMPAGTIVIGHKHRTKHFNVLLRGAAKVIIDGEVKELRAPLVFESEAGVRKVLYILEDCDWATIHATDETDVAKLEEDLIEKSPEFLEHSRLEAEKLKALVENPVS